MNPIPSPATAPRRWAPLAGLAAGAALVVACSTPASDTRAPSAAANAEARVEASAASAPSVADSAPATTAAAAPAAQGATLTVYKSPTCGCCTKWVDHMREHGYKVVVHDTENMSPVKAELGVPEKLGSCHTATVGGYVLEGHVPAADVDRLLRERPATVGLAVPGMPAGSPGMEIPGSPADRYDVVAFARDGATRVFASH